MPRTCCRDCGQDCYSGDLFFACAQCSNICEECAQREWGKCESCGEWLCPLCIGEGAPWPEGQSNYGADDHKKVGGYVMYYECCGPVEYDGDQKHLLREWFSVCRHCMGELKSVEEEVYPKVVKDHEDTMFWCSRCDFDGCAKEACDCSEKRKERSNIPLWKMKHTGPTKVVGEKTYHWCPNHKHKGKIDGLYTTHKPTEHGEWENNKKDWEV